jgi:hypothetical protein
MLRVKDHIFNCCFIVSDKLFEVLHLNWGKALQVIHNEIGLEMVEPLVNQLDSLVT